MGVIQIIGSILAIAIKLFDLWYDKNEEKRKRNKEALSEAIEAIDNNDVSKLNAAIGRMR